MPTNLEDYVYYSAESPTHLMWKVDIRAGKYRSVLKAEAGTPAGSYKSENYYEVGVRKKKYYVHRIIWELFNGKIPNGDGGSRFVIDHIDGNGINNEISNLRLVREEVNMRNSGKRSHNTSGVVGVGWQIIRGVTYARAQWHGLDGKMVARMFHAKRLGVMVAFTLACAARSVAMAALQSNGAGYSERHGT